MAKIAAANAVEEDPEEQKEYEEAEYTNGGTVELELVSVQKDLKIKFNNKKIPTARPRPGLMTIWTVLSIKRVLRRGIIP